MAEVLVRARTTARLTQAEVARRLGTTQSAIARLEGEGVAVVHHAGRYAAAAGTRLTVGLERINVPDGENQTYERKAFQEKVTDVPINQELLDILVCPQTRQSLTLADADEVAAINQRVARRELVNRQGATVTEPVEGALIRADRQVFYPIRHDIPIMLIDEAIALPGDS